MSWHFCDPKCASKCEFRPSATLKFLHATGCSCCKRRGQRKLPIEPSWTSTTLLQFDAVTSFLKSPEIGLAIGALRLVRKYAETGFAMLTRSVSEGLIVFLTSL